MVLVSWTGDKCSLCLAAEEGNQAKDKIRISGLAEKIRYLCRLLTPSGVAQGGKGDAIFLAITCFGSCMSLFAGKLGKIAYTRLITS